MRAKTFHTCKIFPGSNATLLPRFLRLWVGRLMANAILNFHFDFLTTSLRKKEKLIFLKPILDIKTKTCWSSWKGTKVLVPPAVLAELSWKNMPTNAGNVSIKPGNIRNTIVCLANKVNLTYLIPIFNIYNNTGTERAPSSGAPFSYMASWKWVKI